MHRSRPRSLPARRLGPVRRTARTSPGFTLLELLPILLLIVVIILLIYIVSLLDTPASTATISGTTAGPIAALEIVPDVAEVEAESWFRLRARPRDAAGNVIRKCDCVMIEWTLDPAAGPLTDHGTDSPHGVIVQAAAVTTETTVKVSAKLGTVEGEAWITVVPKTATLGDRVEVDHDGGLVEVALVSGKNSAEPSIWRDEPLPFVGFRDLGQMSTGTADRVAVFSSERELGFTGNQPAFAWPGTANSEVVEASRSTPVGTVISQLPERPPDGRMLEVVLNVWIARRGVSGNPALAAAIAHADVRLTNDILRKNRVGVELSIAGGDPVQLQVAKDWNTSDPCFDLSVFTSLPAPAPLLNPGVSINVLYLMGPLTDYAAYACNPAPFIILDAARYQPTQLVHEIGHLFALRDPHVLYWGHTSGVSGGVPGHVPGLGTHNFMRSTTTYDPILQDYISLGQAFRMVADDASFLNAAKDLVTGQSIRQALAIGSGGTIPRPTADCAQAPDDETSCPNLCAFVPPAINSDAGSCQAVAW